MAAKKFTRDAILKAKEFQKYQRDFLAAVLCKEEYTMAEARKAVRAFFEKKECD